MRAARHYRFVEIDAFKAAQSYEEAIDLAREHGMHPMSRGLINIRFHLAWYFRDCGLQEEAIDVMQRLRSDCQNFVSGMATAEPCCMGAPLGDPLYTLIWSTIELVDLNLGEELLDQDAALKTRLATVRTFNSFLNHQRKHRGKEEIEVSAISSEDLANMQERE